MEKNKFAELGNKENLIFLIGNSSGSHNNQHDAMAVVKFKQEKPSDVTVDLGTTIEGLVCEIDNATDTNRVVTVAQVEVEGIAVDGSNGAITIAS